MTDRSPEQVFLDSLPSIEEGAARVCRRHGLFGAEAEDFASFVHVKMIEDNYRRIREFRGRSTLKTYLNTVVAHLLLDFLDETRGRWRTSAKAKRLGPAAERLETLTVRDGLPFQEAFQMLTANEGFAMTGQEVHEISLELPKRIRPRSEPEEALTSFPTGAPSPEESLIAREEDAARFKLLASLQSAFDNLPDADRLGLKLRYKDGHPVSRIARLLGLSDKQLYKRQQRILRRLAKDLRSRGITCEMVAQFDRNPQELFALAWDS